MERSKGEWLRRNADAGGMGAIRGAVGAARLAGERLCALIGEGADHKALRARRRARCDELVRENMGPIDESQKICLVACFRTVLDKRGYETLSGPV
jgi:hypothetical protein